MKSLIMFALRTLKSFFVIPWIMFTLTFKSFIHSFFEFYHLAMEQFHEALDPIIKTIRYGISKVISTIK
jgi:hypothetical protein